MQGGKNRILPKEMNTNRFFWDSHWLEIWSNHLFPSMGPNGGIVAMDSEQITHKKCAKLFLCKHLQRRLVGATNIGRADYSALTMRYSRNSMC